MRANSAALLILFVMTGCDGNRPGVDSQSTGKNLNSQNECENTPCEHVAYMKRVPVNPNLPSKIKLSDREHSSLNAALTTATPAGPNERHIHAAVVDGRFVFSADNASERAAGSHVVGNEPEISLREGGPVKKIVTTAAANELLKKRAVP